MLVILGIIIAVLVFIAWLAVPTIMVNTMEDVERSFYD